MQEALNSRNESESGSLVQNISAIKDTERMLASYNQEGSATTTMDGKLVYVSKMISV